MEPLLVPEFARLSDWLGLWSIEPMAFGLLADGLRRIDFVSHMELQPVELKSAIEKIPGRNGQSIAMIRIAGTMMKSQSSMGGTSTVQIRRDIRQAAADQDVASILLAVDSPGGTVAGTFDLASDVRAARRSKPVIGHIDDMGASAAYHVLSQAEAIYANSPDAMTGSIGTMATVYDYSEAATQAGIKAYLFATGPLKGAGAQGTKLTEEQRAYFQTLIDESQRTFDAAVKRGRGLTDKQLADVRTGAVFLAEDAVGRKLIDGVRPLAKTLDEMTRAIGKPISAASGFSASAGGSLPMKRSKLPMLLDVLEINRGVMVTPPAGAVARQA